MLFKRFLLINLHHPIMKKYLFFSFFLSSLFTFGQQNVPFDQQNFKDNIAGLTRAQDSISAGDALFYDKRSSNDYLALPYYMSAERFNPNNDILNYKIGACMLSHNSPFKTEALAYLEKAYAINPKVAPDIHYFLGRAYHLAMEWEKAKTEYSTYLATLNEKKNAKEIADTKKKIEECNTGEELVKHPVKVVIENLGPNINTQYPEYGVLVNADETEMIFTSKRPETMGSSIDLGSSQYMEDIYISHYVNGEWTKATNSGTALNTEDNDATAGISLDGKTLYLYRGNDGGDLYVTHLTGDTNWSKPELMSDKLNSKYFETSVCVSPDGKIIYFVSERPGGFGGRDIYKIDVDTNGVWGAAQNLGPTINTRYNEEGIAVHPDGKTIYFSSEGHNTMGGYDVFKSSYSGDIKKNYDPKKWAVPENIGYPINTPDDDVFFCISANGKHAYYSSIRKGGEGEKDIYRITFLDNDSAASPTNTIASSKHNKGKKATKQLNIKGVILDSSTNKKVEASVDITDNTTHTVIGHVNANAEGEYHLSVPIGGSNYEIMVTAVGYHPFIDNINVTDTTKSSDIEENSISLKPINIQSLPVGSSIALNNIYYNFNKATLRRESKAELSRLVDILNKNPNLKIELSSYTDNVGSDEYNLKLSEARAKSVVDYLVAHQIDSNRLEYKGYGKSNPVADNRTKQGKKLNRRTEFKILAK